MALPHIKNSIVGRNKWEPIFPNLFEVKIVLPPSLGQFQTDWIMLEDEITKCDIEGAMDTTPETTEQNFLGTQRTFIMPVMGDTRATLTIEINLNLRNEVDNVLYKIFRAWNELNYNINTGEKAMKVDYVAPSITFIQKNKKGAPIRTLIFYDCILKLDGVGNFGKGSHDHSDASISTMSLSFQADSWDDVVA